jgi:hypothetical protein
MATVTFSTDLPGRSHSLNATWERRYSRRFRASIASSDSPLTGPIAIRTALATAGYTIGTSYVSGSISDAWYEVDAGAYLTNIEVDEEGGDDADGRTWICSLEYGPWTPRQQNPLDEPIEFSQEFDNFEIPVDEDTAGNAVVNSAWDRFDPPVTRDDSRPVLTFTRNEPWEPDWALFREYKDSVNDATWFGFPAKAVKFNAPRVLRKWDQYLADTFPTTGGYYAQVTYRFAVNGDTWVKRVLNQGFRYKSGSDRKVALVDGLPAQSPVLLNSSGAITTTPHWLTFDVYEAKDFGALGLE